VTAVEEIDEINPREAAAGMMLLGALMLALVATFVYRTAMVKPTPPRSAPAPAIVGEQMPSATSPHEPAAIESVEASPPADSSDAAASASVEEPPVEGIEPRTPDAETNSDPASEAPPFQPEQAPRFVAPSSRADQ
jgi:hypothetical protein